MTIQQINIGSSPKGEGGDTWREGSEKINGNFQNLDERTTLAQETANSKTANATDAHLLSRSNHTGTQPISTISGLQAALDSAASQINIAGNAATATSALHANEATHAVSSDTADSANHAATAGKLATPRKINGIDFDGSQDITIGGSGGGTSYSSMTSTEAIEGTSTEDRVISPALLKSAITTHAPTQTNIAGNAATATKLATARNIGGVSFDGSDNINLPGVNTVGNQDTTGNAATAGKLTAPVQINGIDFDGSTGITIPTGGFSAGQEYKNMLASRDNNTVYTNNTDTAIFVIITVSAMAAGSAFKYLINNATVASYVNIIAENTLILSFIVPPGATYKVNFSAGTIKSWLEL